jgi:hypothetical protein
MTASDTKLEIKGDTYLLNPQGQLMDSDGDMVAVAVSYGYGVGWSSWNGKIDPTNGTVIRALLEGRLLTPEERRSMGDPYINDDVYNNLDMEWHHTGVWIKINEYDGAESIEMAKEGRGIFLHPSATRQQQSEREALEKASHQRHMDQWDVIANEMYQQVTSEFENSLRLRMGEKTFFLHLPVARSIPYFRVLLESGFREAVDKTSTLEVSTPEVADYFIEFVYRGRMSEGYVEHKEELVSLADMLQYDHMRDYLEAL